MKFFRKHRKAVSPVIAVMLLVAVAVAAVGAYFIWFRSFQTQTQKSVQEQSSGALGSGLQLVSMTDDRVNYYVVFKNTSGSPITLKEGNGSAVVANPGGNLTIGTSEKVIEKESVDTVTVTPGGGFTPNRGTTRTFTITYTVGSGSDERTEVLVTTYTDS